MTDNDYKVRYREYLTYGLGGQYLVKVVIIQFVALLLTYQFARPLSVSVNKPDLFKWVYAIVSIVFLGITLYFTWNMCKRTLSPKMHNLHSVIISSVLYFVVALIVVFSGYTLLIIAVNGLNEITLLDITLSSLFITALTAILTVGYYDEFDEKLPTQDTLEETIEEWIEATDWVDMDDNSTAQRDRLNEFEECCTDLVEVFSNANTTAGRKLAEDIENWVSQFDRHEGLGKELVIRGQNDNKAKNQELKTEHEEYQRIKSKLESISNTYD